ncbi:MAG: exosortase A [Burkholderiaceae bacterium]
MVTGVRQMGLPERAFAGVALVVAVLAAVFWSTSASMVAVWKGSGTYSHGFVIVPAFLWLVWRRRHLLARLPIRPAWWALPATAMLGLLWLTGQWMALAQPSQFALVAMVPAVVAGTLGAAWVRALSFPLVFLFFAVPFGESLVPVLMDWTADFTVAALQMSGVPVYRDGLHFDIPSGRWSVVDSCSGIRYLFATLAVSSLYSWTIYRRTTRRLLFIAVALLVAIVANWVRAYGIVMLGHLSDNRIATGADHLIYGGVFFGVVMALIFALGAVWHEDPPPQAVDREASFAGSSGTAAGRAGRSVRDGVVAVATWAMMLVWPALSLDTGRHGEPQAIAAPPIRPTGGWVTLEQPLASWRPVLRNPAAVSSGSFAKGDRTVGIHVGLFGRSTPESKLTTAMNRLLEPDGLDPNWKLAQQGSVHTQWSGQALDARTGVLVGSEARLLAWQWYWVDGSVTADPLRASALQLLARLRGRNEVSAWITVYARELGDPGGASETLRQFLADASTAIDAALRQTTPRDGLADAHLSGSERGVASR